MKPNIQEEWEKEFDAIIGEMPDRAIMQKYGKEFCIMCGHPTKNDSTVRDIKSFIRKLLEDREMELVEKIGRMKYSVNTFLEKDDGRRIYREGANKTIDDIITIIQDKR